MLSRIVKPSKYGNHVMAEKQEISLNDVYDALQEIGKSNRAIHVILTTILMQLYQQGERLYEDENKGVRLKAPLPLRNCLPHVKALIRETEDIMHNPS